MANAQQEIKTESGDQVDLKKVDAGVMGKSVKALGIKVGKGATVAELVGALSGYFAAKEEKGEESGNCSNCGITYTFDLDSCPACGTAADDEGDEEDSDEGEVEAADDSDEEAERAEAAEAAEAAPPPAPVEEAPKRRKKKEAAAPKAATSGQPNVETKAIVPAKPAQIVSSKDLDAAVVRVRTAMGEGASAFYQIGKELKVIFDGALWKQRVKEDGKPAYKSWDSFISHEIGMNVATSYDVMRVVATFDEKVVREIGQTKLALVLKAPEVMQDAILEKAKGGASAKEVKAEVEAARQKYGPPKSKMKGAKRTEKASAANKKKARKVEKITVAQIINEPHRIPLFTEETIKAGPGHRVRATKFGQKPSGSLILVNGVELHVRVALTKLGAVAVVNFKRSAE